MELKKFDLIKYDAFDPNAPQVFDHVSDKYGKLDILINNAGFFLPVIYLLQAKLYSD